LDGHASLPEREREEGNQERLRVRAKKPR